MRRRRLWIAIVSTLLLCSYPAHGVEATSTFLWLSDLHFDPTARPELVNVLAKADVAEWQRILTLSPPGTPAGFSKDSNWELLTSSLNAARTTAPTAKFTVVTGDIFVHRFREKFEAAATDHTAADFRAFEHKTLQFLASQLKTLAPGKPVFLTLGNNDSVCGDYALQPHGAFLQDESSVVESLLGPLASPTSHDDWLAWGSYSVPNPSLKHALIIALSSVYFSPKYQNACFTDAPTSSQDDPGQLELQWLQKKLAEAAKRHEKVWLIFHIPPGVDGYSTSHPKTDAAANTTAFMWKPLYTEKFEQLLTRYQNTVSMSFAGHEHTDDFRLIGNSLVLMTPGVSPVVQQNPAFRIVTFGRDASIIDETTYYLSNMQDLSGGSAPEWKLEYSFADTWNIGHLNATSLRSLYNRIEKDPEVRARWIELYSVSHPQGIKVTNQTFPSLFCASGNVSEESFRSCVQRLQTLP